MDGQCARGGPPGLGRSPVPAGPFETGAKRSPPGLGSARLPDTFLEPFLSRFIKNTGLGAARVRARITEGGGRGCALGLVLVCVGGLV